MAKKKTKKGQKKSGSPSPMSTDALRTQLSEAWKEHRVRRAYLALKELLGRGAVGPEDQELMVSVVEARLLQMHRQGEDAQLGVMLSGLSSKCPELGGLLRPEYVALSHFGDSSGDYFAAYDHDDQVRCQLDGFVSRLLLDPRELSRHPLLSSDHPLRVAAETIMVAWTGLESGGGYSLAALDAAVGRRSPFVAWRLFLHGLAAYYEQDGEGVHRNLERIASDSPLHELSERLLQVQDSEGKSDQEICRRIRHRTVAESVPGPFRELKAGLNRRMSQQERQRLLRAAFTDELHQTYPTLYHSLGAMLLLQGGRSGYGREWVTGALTVLKDYYRSSAIASCYDDIDQLKNWDRVLSDVRVTALEQALILDRKALLLSMELHPERKVYAPDCFFRPSKVRRDDAHEFYRQMSEFWQKSISAYPLSEVYEHWYKMSDFFDSPARSDKILEAWHCDFPDDAEVVFKLLDSCRKRSVYKKAGGYLSELRRLAPHHADLGRVSRMLELEQLLATIRKKQDVFMPMFMSEGSFSDSFLESFQQVLCRLAQGSSSVSSNPVIEDYLLGRIYGGLQKVPEGQLVFREPIEAESFCLQVETITGYPDVVWGHGQLIEIPLCGASLLHLERVPSERLWRLCRLFYRQLADSSYSGKVMALWWSLVAHGLQRQDSWVGAFLLCRVQLGAHCWRMMNDQSESGHLYERLVAVMGVGVHLLRKANLLEPLNDKDQLQDELYFGVTDCDAMWDERTDEQRNQILKQELTCSERSYFKQSDFPAHCGPFGKESRTYPVLIDRHIHVDDDDDFCIDIPLSGHAGSSEEGKPSAGRTGTGRKRGSKIESLGDRLERLGLGELEMDENGELTRKGIDMLMDALFNHDDDGR